MSLLRKLDDDPDTKSGQLTGLVAQTVREFQEKELLIQASAIALRVITALVPATLFTIALLGALGFESLWRDEALPELRENVSASMYTIIDDAVMRVLRDANAYWVTVGGVLAVLAMASIVDAVTRTLNRIHEAEESRSLVDRYSNAILIGAATGILLIAAIAVVRLGPFALEAVLGDSLPVNVLGTLATWALAAGLLVVVVILMVRVAPDVERPMRRVTFGAAITVGGWILASVVFGLYLDRIAVYDSIFGQIATTYIAIQYIALSAIVYVAGLTIDFVFVREDDPAQQTDAF